MVLTFITFCFLGTFLIPSNAYRGSNINKLLMSNGNASMARQLILDDQEDMRFIAIGDWGSGRQHQKEVADAMGKFCQGWSGNKCDFIISTGDNFYSRGVNGVHDDQFDESWRDVYTHPSIAHLPWYLTVGNHDHGHTSDREWYQVAFSDIEPRWNLPNLAFSFKVSSQSVSATFVSIDTISIEKDKNDASGMINLLKSDLKNAAEGDWKIVFGHYPCHSGGHYSGSTVLQEKVLPIMKMHNVDFYLTGHDHNQQHWVTKGDPRGIEHITTGAGGESEYSQYNHNVRKNEKKGMELEFFDKQYGFSYFVVGKDKITVQFVNDNGQVIHQFTRNKY